MPGPRKGNPGGTGHVAILAISVLNGKVSQRLPPVDPGTFRLRAEDPYIEVMRLHSLPLLVVLLFGWTLDGTGLRFCPHHRGEDGAAAEAPSPESGRSSHSGSG